MWTLGPDQPVIPGVTFIRWASAVLYRVFYTHRFARVSKKITNIKLQISNNIQYLISKYLNFKIWNFKFICYLLLRFWNFLLYSEQSEECKRQTVGSLTSAFAIARVVALAIKLACAFARPLPVSIRS